MSIRSYLLFLALVLLGSVTVGSAEMSHAASPSAFCTSKGSRLIADPQPDDSLLNMQAEDSEARVERRADPAPLLGLYHGDLGGYLFVLVLYVLIDFGGKALAIGYGAAPLIFFVILVVCLVVSIMRRCTSPEG